MSLAYPDIPVRTIQRAEERTCLAHMDGASCNGCHSAGPPTQYAPGGNPYFSQPKQVNPATYLGGGNDAQYDLAGSACCPFSTRSVASAFTYARSRRMDSRAIRVRS